MAVISIDWHNDKRVRIALACICDGITWHFFLAGKVDFKVLLCGLVIRCVLIVFVSGKDIIKTDHIG